MPSGHNTGPDCRGRPVTVGRLVFTNSRGGARSPLPHRGVLTTASDDPKTSMANETNKVIYSMTGVSKSYEKKVILKDIYLSYFYGAKIGVLGLNGSGKSSLLKILAGIDKTYQGQISLSPGYTTGYLEQEPKLDESKTVRQVVEEGVAEKVALVNEFNAISDKLGEPIDDAEMTHSSSGRASSRKRSITRACGTLTRSSIWPWTPCVARRRIPRSARCQAVRSAASPSAACC